MLICWHINQNMTIYYSIVWLKAKLCWPTSYEHIIFCNHHHDRREKGSSSFQSEMKKPIYFLNFFLGGEMTYLCSFTMISDPGGLRLQSDCMYFVVEQNSWWLCGPGRAVLEQSSETKEPDSREKQSAMIMKGFVQHKYVYSKYCQNKQWRKRSGAYVKSQISIY